MIAGRPNIRAKVQLGAELTHLETPGAGDGDVDALTYMFGFRTFF